MTELHKTLTLVDKQILLLRKATLASHPNTIFKMWVHVSDYVTGIDVRIDLMDEKEEIC